MAMILGLVALTVPLLIILTMLMSLGWLLLAVVASVAWVARRVVYAMARVVRNA